jgi:hypothetical protein
MPLERSSGSAKGDLPDYVKIAFSNDIGRILFNTRPTACKPFRRTVSARDHGTPIVRSAHAHDYADRPGWYGRLNFPADIAAMLKELNCISSCCCGAAIRPTSSDAMKRSTAAVSTGKRNGCASNNAEG